MINLDSITNENKKEHNEKWPFILDYLYRILIIGGSGSGKINALLNIIKEQDDIDKKDLIEVRYEFLIKKCEDVGTNHFDDPNAFIECSNRIDDIYQIMDEYNPSRQREILFVLDE